MRDLSRTSLLYVFSVWFIPYELKKELYTVKSKGKATSSKIVIGVKDLKVLSSKLNDVDEDLFTIKKELNKVYICCMCKSTVWIGNKLLQQNQKEKLQHNSVISLFGPRDKLFVYVEKSSFENASFPDDIKKKYTVTYSLGHGGFGVVSLVFHKKTRKKYAVKKVMKNEHQLKYTKGELDILKKLDHPCVIRLEDYADLTDVLYIVLEYMEGGDLEERIKSTINLKTRLKEGTVKLIFYQLASAVDYLHKKGVAHRDLKPANILLASDHEECLIKVTDFGISKIEEDTMLKTRIGTQQYLAPEVLKAGSRNPYTNKVDVWAMGVILFYCLELNFPFKLMEFNHYSFSEASKKDHPFAVDLTEKMLKIEPSNRIDTREILGHQWLKDEEMKQKAEKLMAVLEKKMDENLTPEKPRKISKKVKLEPLKINKDKPAVKEVDLAKVKPQPEPLKIDKQSPSLRNKKPEAAKFDKLPSPRRVSNPPEGNKFLNDTRPGQARGVLRFGSYRENLGQNIQKEAIPPALRRESFPHATAHQAYINDQKHLKKPACGTVEQCKHMFEKR